MAEVLSSGPQRPPGRPPRWLAGAGAAAVGLALLSGSAAPGSRPVPQITVVAAAPAPSCGTPRRPAAAPVVADPGGALVISPVRHGATVERRGAAPARGPWTVVVRRIDGSLGRHGAVVTFPVGSEPGASQATLVWRVGGGQARIRGDLPRPQLGEIAARTHIVRGRPVVHPPPGFRVLATGPYRAAIREVRYGAAELGREAAALGGLVYTGVTGGGWFEDELYLDGVLGYCSVRGRPAVLSGVAGGNATIAWELAPGVVGYVGYSGTAYGAKAATALRFLAERASALTAAGWRATRPQVVG